MNDDSIRALADRWKVPLPAARQLASAVASQCALIANRYEPEGAMTFEQLSAVETLGAQIGAEIISRFPEPSAEPPEQRSANWMGIGGPSKL
jgi:hypothetical protein